MTGQSECSDCAAGTYQNNPASTECLDCATGTWQPDTGATACVDRNDRRCWKAKDLKNPAFVAQPAVPVSDEFATGPVDIKSASLYCAPAGYAGQPVSDPDPRQCCYKVTGAKLDPAVTVQVAGALGGTLQLELSKPSLVCEQCVGTPVDNPLRCWKVKDLKTPAAFVGTDGLAVVDHLASDTVDVTKPALFCAPADVDGAPITDSLAQQCCYKAKGDKLAAASTLNTNGAVGGPLELSVQKQSLVCEPCTSSVVP